MNVMIRCPYCDGEEHYSDDNWDNPDPDYTWMCGFCDGRGAISSRRWVIDRVAWLRWQMIGLLGL